MLSWIKRFLVGMIFLGLVACGSSDDKNTLKVGVISGPDVQLMETAKKVAQEKYQLNLKIIEFTDYIEPNNALMDNSIDANMFQHQPYLDHQMEDRNYKFIVVGKTFVFPMAIYSQKIKDLNHLQLGAMVGIPNDPSNEGRALLLLQKAGLIKISDSAGLYATPANIIENQKQLTFKELDAAQLARSLPDVDIAVINTNYALSAGLSNNEVIYRENKDSPYANIIVVREDEINDPRIKQLVEAIQSPEVEKTAKEIFKDQAIPAWH